MNPDEKALIKSYLDHSLSEIEVSAGRILLHASNEATRAGVDEIEKAKKAAKEFFEGKINEIKKLLCEKYKKQVSEIDIKTDKGLELVGYIAAILESNNVSVGPLNYVFISIWIIKNGLEKICEEKGQ